MVHMTRRSRRSTLLVPVLAGLLTLAACSHGEGSNQSGSAQSPQSNSSSHEAAHSIPMSGEYPILPNGKLGRPVDWVEPHEPQLPSAATNMDAFGARYFAEYYLNLLAYSINTGNTTTLKETSSPECTLCNSFIENISSLYEMDEWAEGIKYAIQSTSDPISHPENQNLYFLTADVMTAAYVEYRNDEITEFDENPLTMEFEIKIEGSSFVMNSFHAKSKEEVEDSRP